MTLSITTVMEKSPKLNAQIED